MMNTEAQGVLRCTSLRVTTHTEVWSASRKHEGYRRS